MENRTGTKVDNQSSRSCISDKVGERILMETMGNDGGSAAGTFPTNLTIFRPMNIVNNVLPEKIEKTPEFADVEYDTTADADADITADMGHDTVADTEADIIVDLCDDVSNDTSADAGADVMHDISNAMEKISTLPTQERAFAKGLFVGNIPLNTHSNMSIDDKIADAFNNSSRKTLSYIPPTIQNGEVVVRPTMETIRNGSTKWKSTAVGYFLGKRPYFYHVKDFAYSVWPGLREVPVWIKLRHLPVELWTEEGLSIVASGIGKLLYPDAITRACTRLDFTRVCVMLDVSSKLPKHIIIMTPDEEGGETPCKIDVEYEWIPPKCTNCMTLGHSVKDSALNKPSKPIIPPVTVYVPKPRVNVRGLNKRDHQLAVKDIIAEFRLQFFGLLETRVSINNAAQIQSFLLPNWKWYVEYGSSGNRVWIAWDDNFIDVEVVECGMQFIHCLVNIRAIHESVAIAVAYGATEVVDRRELWSALENLALQCADIPWLIGGDFNAVRDLSEVCGTSGDIRIAMEDFNAAIQNTGLLPLPMQGEWYTWHNHSATPWNLWKRHDRMLINDRWMAQFPITFYSVLTPCTLDHSPMVLYGDRQQQYGGMFRFDNYLARSPEFIPSVKNIWQHNIIGTPMYAVTRKLKALKPIFRE
ncbi:UNVERIFIED_CONTAM: hypothetical protein Sindi_0720000 [Sesamum indicum]